MNLKLVSVAVLILASSAGVDAAPIALTGATLIDGTGAAPVKDAMVVVDGERIACAGSRDDCPVPEGAEVRKLDGKWITPGLVDTHVHYSQTGWADGRPDSLDVRERHPYPQVIAGLEAHPERWHRAYLCSGVTAVFDVGGYPWTWDVREPAEHSPDAPHFEAAGPLLSTLDHWLNLAAERQFIYMDGLDDVTRGVNFLSAFHTDAVKMWFIVTGDRDIDKLKMIAMAIGEQAHAAGLPFIVHATGIKEARIAVAAGADRLVHSVDDALLDDDFIAAMKQGHVMYTPTLTVHGGYYRMYRAAASGKPPAADDPNHCVDAKTLAHVRESVEYQDQAPGADRLERMKDALGKRMETMDANLKKVQDAGLTVAMGTDAGNPLTLHGPAIYAEMEAMQAAGLTPMQVIVDSTLNGAKAMDRADDFGTVENGKIADLIVLGADPSKDVANFRKLEFVMRAGVMREQAVLQAPGD